MQPTPLSKCPETATHAPHGHTGTPSRGHAVPHAHTLAENSTADLHHFAKSGWSATCQPCVRATPTGGRFSLVHSPGPEGANSQTQVLPGAGADLPAGPSESAYSHVPRGGGPRGTELGGVSRHYLPRGHGAGGGRPCPVAWPRFLLAATPAGRPHGLALLFGPQFGRSRVCPTSWSRGEGVAAQNGNSGRPYCVDAA